MVPVENKYLQNNRFTLKWFCILFELTLQDTPIALIPFVVAERRLTGDGSIKYTIYSNIIITTYIPTTNKIK